MANAIYDVSLAWDTITRRGIPGQFATVTDAATDMPVDPILDLDGNPIAALVSNSQGYVQGFQVTDGPPLVKLTVGPVSYTLLDMTRIGEATAAAQAAAQAAQDAANLVEAPADEVVALLAENPATLTRSALDLLYVPGTGLDGLVAGNVGTDGTATRTAVNARISETLQQALGAAVTTDELEQTILVDTYAGVSTNPPNGIATILYAPYKMRITRLTLMFDRWSIAVNATDYVTFTLRKWDPATASGQSIVIKQTSTEAVTSRKPWLFDALSWNTSAAVIEQGQAVSIGWAKQGASTVDFPMLVSIGVEPL